MKIMNGGLVVAALSLQWCFGQVLSFSLLPLKPALTVRWNARVLTPLYADQGGKKKDPYGDFDYSNYEVEFTDYSDPDYQIDMGDGEMYGPDRNTEDEATLEKWREERRKRNDEFQMETYFQNIWNGGEGEYFGEWTTYGTSTFIPGLEDSAEGVPSIVQAKVSPKVVSSAAKELKYPGSEWRGDRHVLKHAEYQVTNEAAEESLRQSRDTDTDSGFGRLSEGDNDEASTRTELTDPFWPLEMKSFDFRGPQGNMVVGNGYTICSASQLNESKESPDDGPFTDKRVEVGIQEDDLRMRVKLHYQSLENEQGLAPLHLRTITVCRERLNQWPSRNSNLFGFNQGAQGGLYDPPPLGGKDDLYMSLDLEGCATLLFPHVLHQDDLDPKSSNVVSLDWTPAGQRFQVDRKFWSGSRLKNLKTLELSEVQALQADTYRPRSGPADMRQ